MYLTFYDLQEPPFNLAPNPKFFYPSAPHQETLTALLDAVRAGTDVMVLTGNAGIGKTTVLQTMIERLPDRTAVAYVPHWRLDAMGVTEYALRSWGIESQGPTRADDLRRLEEFFLGQRRAGRRALLVLDAAEHASVSLLAALRMMQTFSRGGLQLLLAGQPVLTERLTAVGLERLASSVGLRRHLPPLSGGDVRRYIHHRLDVVGSPDHHLFTSGAIRAIVASSQDSLQAVNVLCDTCLLTAYGNGAHRVDEEIVHDVIRFIDGAPVRPFHPRPYTDPVAFLPPPVLWTVRSGAVALMAALIATVAFSARAMGWLGASDAHAALSSLLAR